MVPLTRDKATIDAAIEGLDIAGGGATYSGLGVIWGWRHLHPDWRTVWGGTVHPVDPDDAEWASVTKAVVLLTDGVDNWPSEAVEAGNAAWKGKGVAVDRQTACTAAKDDGVLIFVVAALKADSTFKQGLEDCSSKADDPKGEYVFADTQSASELRDAFVRIAEQLARVRKTG